MKELPTVPAHDHAPLDLLPGRRSVLGWVTYALGAVATAVLGLPVLGYFLGVRFPFEALFDRASALYLHVRFLHADFGVAVFDPVFRVRQVFGRVEALGGRVADVDRRAAGRPSPRAAPRSTSPSCRRRRP